MYLIYLINKFNVIRIIKHIICTFKDISYCKYCSVVVLN